MLSSGYYLWRLATAIIKRQLTYRCYDGCKQSGCPTHEGTLEVQTTSQAYTFNLDGRELFFERGELEVIMDLIVITNRSDCVTIPY